MIQQRIEQFQQAEKKIRQRSSQCPTNIKHNMTEVKYCAGGGKKSEAKENHTEFLHDGCVVFQKKSKKKLK